MSSVTTRQTLLEFRKEQRSLQLMPLAQCLAHIETMRATHTVQLFGQSVHNCRGLPSAHQRRAADARFSDDLRALKCFVVACQRLTSSPNSLAGLGGGPDVGVASGCRSQRALTCFEDTKLSRCLDDYVDVGRRLSQMEESDAHLLIACYVFRVKAALLAEELHISVWGLGGRLSHARRRLKSALEGLIPAAAAPQIWMVAEQTATGERRAKVARFLRKRAEVESFWEVAV